MGVREPNAYAGAHIICHVLNDVIKLDGNSGTMKATLREWMKQNFHFITMKQKWENGTGVQQPFFRPPSMIQEHLCKILQLVSEPPKNSPLGIKVLSFGLLGKIYDLN